MPVRPRGGRRASAPSGRNGAGPRRSIFLGKNKCSTQCNFHQGFLRRPHDEGPSVRAERRGRRPDATDAAPTGSRRAADAMRTATESRRAASTLFRKQGIGSWGTGRFCAGNRRVTGQANNRKRVPVPLSRGPKLPALPLPRRTPVLGAWGRPRSLQAGARRCQRARDTRPRPAVTRSTSSGPCRRRAPGPDRSASRRRPARARRRAAS